jgi:hypothetical protein
MTQDCLKLEHLDAIKGCLSGKAIQLHNSNIEYFESMHRAMLQAINPAQDLKLSEVTGRIEELEKHISQNRFSIGSFLFDLVMSAVLSPVLGTAVGKLVAGPLVNLIAPRSRMLRLSGWVKTVKTMKPQPADTARRRLAVQLAEKLFGKSDKFIVRYELDDVATGVVVDTFELIGDKIHEVLDTPPNLIPFSRKDKVSAYSATPNRVEMESEFVHSSADRYLIQQKRITEETTASYLSIINRVDDELLLKLIQGGLDNWNEPWLTFDLKRAELEMQNFTKMILVLLYFGDPKGWLGDRPTRSESTTKRYHYEIGLDTRLPDKTIEKMVTNFMVPGTLTSYLIHTTGAKRARLGRKSGPGIEEKGVISGDDIWGPGPVRYGQGSANPKEFVPSLSNPLFTAKETAFHILFSDMQRLYGKITDKGLDVAFEQRLERNRPAE